MTGPDAAGLASYPDKATQIPRFIAAEPFDQQINGPDVMLREVYPVVECGPGWIRVIALAPTASTQDRIIEALNGCGVVAQQAVGCGAWQPIETAPRDHFPRLVRVPYGTIVAFLDATWVWWPSPAIEPLDCVPTHWMPLPAAPSLPSTSQNSEAP